ncbi:tetratricopeptide repeat protein [candidate division WOR-3 bacterium]|nr:tetratricopeptide repeat protein [candidate division WOR-3 bacterium]
MNRLILGILLLINCAYYNTFYNARKYFDDGLKQQKEGRSGAQDFQKSVLKCNKVIARYPGSKWMDDALFLLGKNFYYLDQLSKAKLNFRKIIEHYPDSPFYPESMLYLGKISMEEGGFTEAFILLDRATDSGDLKIKMEAFKTKLEIHLRSDSPEEAIAAGKEFINEYSAHKAEVYYIMGNAYSRIGDHEKALEMYKKSISEAKDLKLDGLRYKLASVYMELDSLAKALSVIGEYKGSDSLVVLKGKIQRKIGRSEEAEETLKFAKNWRNELGAIANYELGFLKETEGDLEKAEKFYSKTIEIGNFGRITNLARARKDILSMLSLLDRDTSVSDSTGYVEDLAYVYFRIGELYYIEINDQESAIENYKKVFMDFPESVYAPKAIYVLLNILSRELNDSSQVSFYLFKLKDLYPETEFAKKALEEFSGFLPDTTSN